MYILENSFCEQEPFCVLLALPGRHSRLARQFFSIYPFVHSAASTDCQLCARRIKESVTDFCPGCSGGGVGVDRPQAVDAGGEGSLCQKVIQSLKKEKCIRVGWDIGRRRTVSK